MQDLFIKIFKHQFPITQPQMHLVNQTMSSTSLTDVQYNISQPIIYILYLNIVYVQASYKIFPNIYQGL